MGSSGGTVGAVGIAEGSIDDGDIASNAAIAESKIASLTTDLAAKAPLASPTFTGTVAASTTNVGAFSATSTTLGGATAATQVVVDSSGRTGLGIAAQSDTELSLLVGNTHPGTAADLYGLRIQPRYAATTTSTAISAYSQVRTIASAFTLAQGFAFWAEAPTVGAGSAITTARGFYAANQGASGVTNAYGLNVAATSGAATLNVSGRIDTGTTCALWLGGDTTSTTVAGGIAFGSGRDVAFFRSGSAAASLTGKLSVSGNFGCNGVSAPAQPAQPTKPAATGAALASYGYAQAQADAIVTALNAVIDVLHNNGMTA